jgi:hypothetical protein
MSSPAQFGIRLADERPGKHRLPCPECGKGAGDDALELTVTPRRWTFWKCWRCAWEGGAPLDEPAPRSGAPPRPRLVEPRPIPSPSGLSPVAEALLRGCCAITAASIAGGYFRARGCRLPENDVFWHPALRHPSGHVGPAIVAVVTDALTGERISLHRPGSPRTAAARPTSPSRGCS